MVPHALFLVPRGAQWRARSDAGPSAVARLLALPLLARRAPERGVGAAVEARRPPPRPRAHPRELPHGAVREAEDEGRAAYDRTAPRRRDAPPRAPALAGHAGGGGLRRCRRDADRAEDHVKALVRLPPGARHPTARPLLRQGHVLHARAPADARQRALDRGADGCPVRDAPEALRRLDAAGAPGCLEPSHPLELCPG